MPPSASADSTGTTLAPPKRVNQFSAASKRATPPPSVPTQMRPSVSCAMVRTKLTGRPCGSSGRAG